MAAVADILAASVVATEHDPPDGPARNPLIALRPARFFNGVGTAKPPALGLQAAARSSRRAVSGRIDQRTLREARSGGSAPSARVSANQGRASTVESADLAEKRGRRCGPPPGTRSQVVGLLRGARTRRVAVSCLRSGDSGPGCVLTGARLRGARARACWPRDGPIVCKRLGGGRFAMKRQPREAPLRLGLGLQ